MFDVVVADHVLDAKVVLHRNNLAVDKTGQFGQVRKLDITRIEGRKRDLLHSPPVGLLQLLVWQEPGM